MLRASLLGDVQSAATKGGPIDPSLSALDSPRAAGGGGGLVGLLLRLVGLSAVPRKPHAPADVELEVRVCGSLSCRMRERECGHLACSELCGARHARIIPLDAWAECAAVDESARRPRPRRWRRRRRRR
jgi:hypothetical protein